LESTEREERENREALFRLEMYKIADANHRFYVDKRFKIISLYYPSTTLVLTALYYIATKWYMQTLLSLIGVLLTLFLFELESRNWLLSNICSDRCVSLGSLQEGEGNLHAILSSSYKAPLPAYSTAMDKLVRKIAPTQHKAVSHVTVVLVVLWLVLMVASLPASIYGDFLHLLGVFFNCGVQ
jgi:hypothetical protein